MSRHVIAAAFLVLAGSVGHAREARAQTPPPVEKPADQNKPAPRESGQPFNVKLDLTITDQLGPGDPAKKTLSMIVADRSTGSIRSMANTGRGNINVDATPQIQPNGSIKVQLGIEYNPRQGPGAAQKLMGPGGDVMSGPLEPAGSSLNQRVGIILEAGKPLVISQAADPISDRKITVEIRATVIK